MTDKRTIKNEINLPEFFEALIPYRNKAIERTVQLLTGKNTEDDGLQEILENFAFHARFQAIYQYENPKE